MEDLTDIKNIWLTAHVDALPTPDEALRIVRYYRFKMIAKKSAAVLLLLLMTVLMVWVVIYGPQMMTTKIGETGFFAGIFVLIVSNANSLKRAVRQVNRTNREFIEYLKQAQRGRIYFYEKVQPAIFTIMSLSLFLIVFESVSKCSVVMLIVYLILTAYVAVMWFAVRPRIIKKQTKRLKETIEKLETLS